LCNAAGCGKWRSNRHGSPQRDECKPGEALVRHSRSGAAAHRQCESTVCVAQNVEAIVSESLQFRAKQASPRRLGDTRRGVKEGEGKGVVFLDPSGSRDLRWQVQLLRDSDSHLLGLNAWRTRRRVSLSPGSPDASADGVCRGGGT
jgi:hypothetical protein